MKHHDKTYRHEVKTAQYTCPGKLILCGEHAVVSGAPAIACSIHLYCRCRASYNASEQSEIYFSSSYLTKNTSYSIDALEEKAEIIEHQLRAAPALSKGTAQLQEDDLLIYTVSMLQKHLQQQHDKKIPAGKITLEYKSTITARAGMGSSAAVICCTLKALAELFNLALSDEELTKIATSCEQLAHGRSSGIDIHMALQPGLHHYQRGKLTRLSYPLMSFYIINSGTSASTTADCVAQSQRIFKQIPSLIEDFSNTTSRCLQALAQGDRSLWQKAVCENHTLLQQLGVVPDRLCSFINTIERQSIAAKICGSGATSGDSAGILLAICKNKEEKNALYQACKAYGYTIEKARLHRDTHYCQHNNKPKNQYNSKRHNKKRKAKKNSTRQPKKHSEDIL